MAFIYDNQSIIKKSNGDILNFFIKDLCLYFSEFTSEGIIKEPKLVLRGVNKNHFDIKIDDKDIIYGIINKTNGEVVTMHSRNNNLELEDLFEYDTEKYILIYPYINKTEEKKHIVYYYRNLKDQLSWAIIHHFFDGTEWFESQVDIIYSDPVINPFFIVNNFNKIKMFYFKHIEGSQEIVMKELIEDNKTWTDVIQITNTNNKKLNLDVILSANIYHICWGEFINENLVIRYKNIHFNTITYDSNGVLSLSDPSNCSFPNLIMTNQTLWCVWLQMNKLYSCYSLDNGTTWSKPQIDSQSIDTKYIKYKFYSNHPTDKNSFKLNSTFGTYHPSISFLGFKNT